MKPGPLKSSIHQLHKIRFRRLSLHIQNTDPGKHIRVAAQAFTNVLVVSG
jgi:hypothetical protein